MPLLIKRKYRLDHLIGGLFYKKILENYYKVIELKYRYIGISRSDIMNKSHFIAGVCEKYDSRLLKNRLNIEANVVSVLWKDPLLLDDNESLTERDFYTKDGRLLFGIAITLRSKRLDSFDEVVNLKPFDCEPEYAGIVTTATSPITT